MKSKKIAIVATAILPLILVLYLCSKSIENWNAFSGSEELQKSYISWASEVKSGKYTNAQIAAKFDSLAAAEKKVSQGAKLIQSSYYFWGVLFVAIAVLQLLVLFRALDTHNNHRQ